MPSSGGVSFRYARMVQHLQINQICHIKKMKDKNHMITSINAAKSSDKLNIYDKNILSIKWVQKESSSTK